jgi:hypothetical protein
LLAVDAEHTAYNTSKSLLHFFVAHVLISTHFYPSTTIARRHQLAQQAVLIIHMVLNEIHGTIEPLTVLY